jgi:hypothetical protein
MIEIWLGLILTGKESPHTKLLGREWFPEVRLPLIRFEAIQSATRQVQLVRKYGIVFPTALEKPAKNKRGRPPEEDARVFDD